MIPTETDVVIVGAGPTGLMLAGDLAAAGVRTTVLERRAHESNLTRAFGVHARTLEMLDARDLADELVATGGKVFSFRLYESVYVDMTILPSRFPYVLVSPQYDVERGLRRRAEEHGAEIFEGAEFVDLHQDADGVSVAVAGGQQIRASYLVGADGFHSRVREKLGLPFPGKSILQSLMLADVRLTDAPESSLAFNAVGDYFSFIAPFGDGWYRVFAWNRHNQQPDTAPVEFEEVRETTRLALGTDYGMRDPRWMSRFHNDERQVPQYRVGRAFLAGDAAHVHSLAGGQGMNTGIQDAANLSWKLAASINGWAPEGLLDTYHAERHPVGRMVIRASGAIIRLATVRTRPQRTARNVIGTAAMKVPPVKKKVAGALSGIGIGYPAPRGAHALTGDRAADVPLAPHGQSEGRLYQMLRHGYVLLAPSELSPIVQPWSDRVRLATSPEADASAILVRPDGYIAWATNQTHPQRRDEEVRDALATHCGHSSHTTSASVK